MPLHHAETHPGCERCALQQCRHKLIDQLVGDRRLVEFALQNSGFEFVQAIGLECPGVHECHTQTRQQAALIADVPAGIQEQQHGDRQKRLQQHADRLAEVAQ